MTPELRLACEAAGEKAVAYTASKLLVEAAAKAEGADVGRRVMIALGLSLATWLQGTAPDGIDPNLLDLASTDLELVEGWATWTRTDFPDDVPLRDAMADEIDSAIAAALA